jgi:hypothetical protein
VQEILPSWQSGELGESFHWFVPLFIISQYGMTLKLLVCYNI